MFNTNKLLSKLTLTPQLVLDMLNLTIGSPEHPIHHPEGTLDKHIDIVLGRCMQRNNINLWFTGLFHDITKPGICPQLWDGVRGDMKTIDSGSYWQNIHHDMQAKNFVKLPEITRWILDNGGCPDTISKMVGNHMRMKVYLNGEKGNVGGMKQSKRDTMKNSLSDVWDDLYYFSTYCDNMKVD